MSPPTTPLVHPRVESALVLLQKAVTPEQVWEALVPLVRGTLPIYNVLLGLPSVGITPMFMRATLPITNLPRFAELAPLNEVIQRRPPVKLARMSDHFSLESPRGRMFFEEFMVPMGWRHAAAFLFWAADGSFLGQLSPIRTEAQGDFTDAEMALLGQLYPHVEAAILRLLKLEGAFAAHHSLEHAIDCLPLPIVVVGWDGATRFSNAAGRDALAAWHANAQETPRSLKPTEHLPAEIAAACALLKTSWQEAAMKDDFSNVLTFVPVEHPRIPDFRAAVQLVKPQAGRALQPAFAASLQQPARQNVEVGRALAALSKLSKAEREIVRLAAAGDDNADIARTLGVSLSTVRTHLRSIFKKLGISSRSRLAPLHQAFQSNPPAATGSTQTR